jgi:hypothetical protein
MTEKGLNLLKYSWKIPGDWYHNHKNDFKRIRDEYGRLRYLGFQEMAWESDVERVTLLADRVFDEKLQKDVTHEVTMIWEGKMSTWMLEQMKEMFKSFATDNLREELLTFDKNVDAEILVMRSSLNRPPDGFINAHIKKRLMERKEILKKYENIDIDDGYKETMSRREIFGT